VGGPIHEIQRNSSGPSCESWPGARFRSDWCTVTSRPQWRTASSEEEKRQNATWQAVDAVVQQGRWDTTVFLLTWDDWGGWDDHVATPAVAYTPRQRAARLRATGAAAHLRRTRQMRFDSRWCSHVSIPRRRYSCSACPRSASPASTTTPASPTSSTPPSPFPPHPRSERRHPSRTRPRRPPARSRLRPRRQGPRTRSHPSSCATAQHAHRQTTPRSPNNRIRRRRRKPTRCR